MDLKLTPIAQFDARRGYRRWCLPGVGVRMGDSPQAVADIWEDREGRLFTRFESLGYLARRGDRIVIRNAQALAAHAEAFDADL